MKYNGLKRTISGILASFMLLSCTSGAVVSFAAVTPGIKFVAEDSESSRVIEGGVVNAQAVLPPSHTFDTDEPFRVLINGKPADKGLIRISSNNGTYYTIIADTHSAKGSIPLGVSVSDPTDGTANTNYTLEANLTANLTDGTGTLLVPEGPTPPPPSTDPPTPALSRATKVRYVSEAGSPTKLPITKDSSFQIKVTVGEPSIESNRIDFGAVTNGEGYFETWNGKSVSVDGFTKSGGKKVIKITIDSYSFELTVELPSDMLILKDSVFTVNYRLQKINPLILHVVSPQWAVNETRDSIQNNPIDPLVPDKYKIPYIRLAANSGDTLSSITTNFDVLAKVERYNSKDPNMLKVVWDWVPDDKNNKNVVAFGDDGRQIRSVSLNPRLDDVTGKLTAIVRCPLIKPYKGKTFVESTPSETGVTILGTGIPPKLNVLTTTTGQNPAVATDILPRNMDVYDGKVPPDYDPQPSRPYMFTANMIFGSGRGRAEKTIIRAQGVTPDAVKIYVDNSPVAYDFGTDIINTDKVAGSKALTVVAVKSGGVRLYFDYYVRNNKNQLVKADSSTFYDITVTDTTPSDFAQLFALDLKAPALDVSPPIAGYPGGAILYGFKPDVYLYSNIELPYVVNSLIITPTVFDNRKINTTIKYEIKDGGDLGGILPIGTLESGGTVGGKAIPMYVEAQRTITLTLTAQNGREQLYIITVNRMPPDRNSELKNLTVTDVNGGAIIKGFSPTQTEYVATVPYKTRWARFAVEKANPWQTFKYVPEKAMVEHPDDPFGGKNWLKLQYPGDIYGGVPGFNGLSSTTEEKVTVDAQDGTLHPDGSRKYTTTYSVKIIRDKPSTNTLATTLTIKDNKNRPVNFDNGKKFDKNDKTYGVHIPYSSNKLTLSILPDDVLAESVTVTAPGGVIKTLPYTGNGTPLDFELDTPMGGNTPMTFALSFTVMSEAGGITTPPYTINVVRNDPDQDSSLTSLEVTDQNDVPVKTFTFNPQTTLYNFSVPFDTEQIRVKPKPRSELATAKVNGETIDEKKPYYITLIKPGETKNIKVEIFPEDISEAPRVYDLTVMRELPNTDARLKELTVNGGEGFSPRFVPNTILYSVKIPEGTKNVTFTATPLGVGSTMTLNGETLPAALPSAPYEPYEAKSVVKIEVTAQDGVTKMTYTINVTNQNLLPRSSNADLASLDIREGSMSPRFKAGVTEYEVAVKDDISSVDILPVPRDEGATMKVFADSKELGDYYDRYSTAIRDGETTITVEVTAEDGKTKRTYETLVYRKDEEKQGTYKPITAEMVNYDTNPIVVDISRYTVIAADVLNTLKEKYPEKTMIFEGNDYSLQITGKDIATLIPHTATFDLGISFSSPYEDDIWRFIYDHPRNDGIEPVFIHFNHHGVLPGRMLFSISLGRAYRTQNATWNYYNEERERIDYYGGVRTNSRGTFTVPITHMSTYIYCEDRIDGAENKSGELGQIGDKTGSSGITKPNPNTAAGGERE